ncbi:MAG: hypothetical protein KC503_02975, partial [Myxococcales bacterium]|nr:hypothetical protein [Myxococcales bacterium]
MSTSSPSPRADHPTLVLEVGRLARAVRRLLLGSSPRAGDDEDATVLRRPNLSLVRAEGELEGDVLRGELDRLLSLPEMIANQNAGGPPRLYVFIIADVTEPGVAEAVQRAHGALLELVSSRYAPLFQGYREGIAANLHVNPLLVLPAPGEPWPKQVQALMGRLEAMQRAPTTPPPVNNIFVVGETSGGYMLERDEIAQMLATFVELSLSGELSRSSAFERLLDRAPDPYGTFVCATIDFDTREAVRYGGRETAIQMMQWLRRTSEERTRVAERASEVEELFEVSRYAELVPLEKGDAALSRAIDSQCPDFSGAFRDVALLEDGESVLAHYDEPWRDQHRSSIEAASRELGLFRIDEIIEEVEVNGASLAAEERARLDAFIGDKLSRPSEGNVADVALSLRHLRKRLGA